MEWIQQFIDFVLHLDEHLDALVRDYGAWTYAILFLIIFCETGLVVTPFLPGDSLLFAVGAVAATGALDPLTRLRAALRSRRSSATPSTTPRATGSAPSCSRARTRACSTSEHLERTHRFYEKYGGKTIIFARFIPIIRTFAPFVAGIGRMTYSRFLAYNVIGGVVWIAAFVSAGYFFGNIPVVKDNFSLVILAIIVHLGDAGGDRVLARALGQPEAGVTERRCVRRPQQLRDHAVRVAAQRVELLLQRGGVGLVGVAEADDRVGDALVLEPADAVDGVGVHRDHVDLERLVRGALLLAVLRELREQRVEVVLAAAVHPAVAQPRGAAQRGVGVAAEQDRHRVGHRAELERRDVVEAAVVFEELAACRARAGSRSSRRAARRAPSTPCP